MLIVNLYNFLTKLHNKFHNKNTDIKTKLTSLTAFTFCVDFTRQVSGLPHGVHSCYDHNPGTAYGNRTKTT
jgi:hypothetical protein